MKNILEIKSIDKSYGSSHILKSLDFSMSGSDLYSIMGKSGSGKTTLLRIIAGLEKADKGIVRIGGNIASGKDVFLHPSERRLGFVFQNSCLWPHMTMRENIGYAMSHEYESRLDDIAHIAGIDGIMDKYANEVSEGQGKRVSIVRALCSGADLILLDEPFANLDSAIKKSIMDLLGKIRDMDNTAMLMVSHNMEENVMFSDRIFQLEDGKLYEK